MSKGFQKFLVGLLAFCVLFGAFCILYPIMSRTEEERKPYIPGSTLTKDPVATPPVDEPSTPSEPVPEPEPEPEPTVSVEQEKAQAMLETMTLEEKIYQMFFVTPEALTGVTTATRAGDSTKTAIEEQPVGGIVYFAANLENRDQTTEMIENSQSYAKIPMFIGVDEEGGTVSRLGSNSEMGVTKLPNMRSYGDEGDAQKVMAVGKVLASELLELGFNVNFAPVADVDMDAENSEIGSRSFSSDPQVAAKMVGSIVSGMKEGGVISTLKHFPGLGSSTTDTHSGKSVISKTMEELRAADFVPFQAGMEAGCGMVMVGHMTLGALYGGDNMPSDLSRDVVTGILREELGYDGVVITDSHEMGSITEYYDPDEAAVKAIAAGVDIVLMPDDLKKAVTGVQTAVDDGTLTEARIDESVLRVLTLKYEYGILS